jgi:glycosyltransferase involved in cell wall biosynthesis
MRSLLPVELLETCSPAKEMNSAALQHALGRAIKVSLYIPCYNVEAYLAPVLEGVLKQTLALDEILVIDDGSKDRTREIAARYPVTVVRHEHNRGLAAARNTGILRARNDLVAWLDADCVPDPKWLEILTGALAGENVVMVGGRLVESVQRSLADRWRRAHMPQDWGATRLSNPKFMFGNNGLGRKAAIEEAGGYNERFTTNGEDVDISQRLRARGRDFVYEPSATVSHLRRDTVTSVLNAYWRWWRCGVNAYANGVRLRSVVATFCRAHFGTSFLELVGRDLKQREFELLPLDVLALGYMPYRDLRLYLEARLGTRAQGISAEVKAP